jgi:hypothetical protein
MRVLTAQGVLADAEVFDVTVFLAASAAQVFVGSTPANAIKSKRNRRIRSLNNVTVVHFCLHRMIYGTRFSGGNFQVPSKASAFGQ